MAENTERCIIIGGGISGLTAAFHLLKANMDVTLIESAPSVGGYMQTDHREGFLLEKGPFNVIVRDPAFQELLESLSENLEVVKADRIAHKRYLYRHNRIIAVPTNPVSMALTPLLSVSGKARTLAGLAFSRGPRGECTLNDFASRRLGQEFSDTVFSAIISGILAGDIDKLSLNACFPTIAACDREMGSPLFYGLRKALAAMKNKNNKPKRRWRGLVSVDKGLGVISDSIAGMLSENLYTGCTANSITRSGGTYEVSCDIQGEKRVFSSNRLLLATPVSVTASLLSSLAPVASETLRQVESASLTVINLAYRKNEITHPLDGFGFLVPRNEPGYPLMGILWADSAFPHHAPEGYRLLRVFIGGVRTPNVIDISDGELLKIATDSVRETLGATGEPFLAEVCPHPQAIPQYHLGHLEKIKTVKDATASLHGLRLAGNYLEGVSVNDCIRLAKKAALEIIEEAEQ